AFRDKLRVCEAEEGVHIHDSLANSHKQYRCVVVQAVPSQVPHPTIYQAHGPHDHVQQMLAPISPLPNAHRWDVSLASTPTPAARAAASSKPPSGLVPKGHYG